MPEWKLTPAGQKYYRRYNREYAKSHRGKAVMRRARLKYLFGLTPEQYTAMLAEQNGCCAICRIPPLKQRLDVDHDHGTGKIRGLLCRDCNLAIGKMRDDSGRLRLAAEYLEREAG